jgi:hypothetical protein
MSYMATDRLRVEGNERMDLADFQFSLGDQTLAVHRQLLSQLICSPDRERKWVLSGFAITSPTGTQVQVTKGRGLFAETRSGEVNYGILTTEGDATKIVDINTYPTGLYGVYVRFDEVEGNFQPRIFWNASGLGSEYTETIATRYLASWSVRIEATSPGDEWLQIGTVNRADMALVDMRDFYFEGPVDDSYKSGWSTDGGGGANDRSADRKTYGVTDFHQFVAATRQCLEDIKGRGLRRWWDRSIGGLNLGFDGNPVEGRLALGDANYYFEGGSNKRWQFDVNDSLSFNSTSNVFTMSIGAAIHNWDAVSQSPETTNTVDLGKTDKRYANLYLSGSLDSTGSIKGSSLTLSDSLRMSRAAAGAGERNWQLSIADVGGFETFQIGSQNDAWSSFAAALSITRAVDAGTITKFTLPNGFYYDVANYSLCGDGTSGSLGKTAERWVNGFFTTLYASTIRSTSLTIKGETEVDVNVLIRGAILPISGQSLVIGSATVDERINNGYFDYLNVYLGLSVVDDKVASNLIPDSAARTIGRTGRRWEGFFGNLTADTIYLAVAAGHGVATSAMPTEDNTLSLGGTNYRWAYGCFGTQISIDAPTAATVNLLMGSGTAADRNWGFTADTVLRLRTYDGSWANAIDVFTISRSGTSPTYMTFSAGMGLITAFLQPLSDGGGSVGVTGARFADGYINTLHATTVYASGAVDAEGAVSGTTGTFAGTLLLPGFSGAHGRELQWEWAEGGTWSPWIVLYSDCESSYAVGLYTQYWTKFGGLIPIIVNGQVLIGEAYTAHVGNNVSAIHGLGSVVNRGFITLRFTDVEYVIPVWYSSDLET